MFKVERDRTQLLVQTMKELNTHYNLYNRRATNAPPLAVHRVKVTFKDEPGEGTGVTRSFYTAIAEVCCIIIEIILSFYFKNVNIYIYIFKGIACK